MTHSTRGESMATTRGLDPRREGDREAARSMADIVPKGQTAPRAPSNVRSIRSAGHAGGRKSSTTYDPATGEEVTSKGYLAKASHDSDADFDVFKVVDSKGYSEDRFYCRSVNADGHGERMQLRMPQGIDAQLYAAVAAVNEYNTLQDFFRDAALHRLEYIQKRYALGDDARRALELERMRADRERRAQETEVMQENVDDLADKLQRLWDKGDWSMMTEELEKASEVLDWLREPYRGRAAQVVADWRGRSRDKIRQMLEEMEE